MPYFTELHLVSRDLRTRRHFELVRPPVHGETDGTVSLPTISKYIFPRCTVTDLNFFFSFHPSRRLKYP